MEVKVKHGVKQNNMDNFDLRKYLAENKLLKEDAISKLKSKVKDMSKEEFIKLAKRVGDLSKFKMASKGKKDDGTPIDPFSNIDDRLEVIDQNFDEKDAEKYLAENKLTKEEELTWFIEDENSDVRYDNEKYLKEVGDKIKELRPDISDEDLDEVIFRTGEQYSREKDFHGDSITSGNFADAAVEIYQTDVLGSGSDKDDEDFDEWAPENLDVDFPKDSMFAGWTQAQYDAYQKDPYAYLKDKSNPRLKTNLQENFDLRKYLTENKLLKESLGSDPKYYVKYTTQDGETAKSGLMSKREAIYKERDLVDSGVKKSSVWKFIKNVDLNGKPYVIDTELDKEIDYRKDEKGRPINENNLLKEFIGGELETRNEPLFDKLVPVQGKAETLEGEMLRAINRMVYRYYNDGDKYYEGYGAETAGPAVSFLVNAIHPLRAEMSRIMNGDILSDNEYENMLKEALGLILDYIESKEGEYTKNTQGEIFDYESEYEDDDDYYDDYEDDDDYYQE